MGKKSYWKGPQKQRLSYWDERGKRIRWYRGDWFYTITELPYYVYRRNWLLRQFSKIGFSGKHILEIGCGDGYYCSHFWENYKRVEVHGVDFSCQMLSLAKKRFREKKAPCSFFQAKAEELPFRRDGFDVVVILSVLAHLNDEELNRCLAEVARITRKQAKLLVFVKVASQIRWQEIAIRRKPEAYINLFQFHGFKLEKQIHWSSPLFRKGMEFYDRFSYLYKRLFNRSSFLLRLEYVLRNYSAGLMVGLTRLTDRFWQEDIGNEFLLFSK
ncbi:MAG: class I SAM-dependent methyltransferase [Acidobacteriota bacterium]